MAKQVIRIELQAIEDLKDRINHDFAEACHIILNCTGRVIVLGMGKSGHIARKIAATLASTGSPAFFIHPAEANHGDLGMMTSKDVVIAISNSGETPELLNIIPLIKRLDIPLIAFTGHLKSTLARTARIHLDTHVKQEACSLGLAPTSSTTAALVMGDALAIALLEARGFTSEDFARFHPAGTLGRHLLLNVKDIMHIGDEIPIVKQHCILDLALVEITQKSLGMTAIVDPEGILVGIFTDGDLRRVLDKNEDIHTTPISKVMTHDCMTISPKQLAAEALNIMQKNKVTSLVVIDTPKQPMPIGVIHMHDLLRAGVV